MCLGATQMHQDKNYKSIQALYNNCYKHTLSYPLIHGFLLPIVLLPLDRKLIQSNILLEPNET